MTQPSGDGNKLIVQVIYVLVIGIVTIAYGGVVIWAGIQSIDAAGKPDEIPDALTAVATGVGGVLATNFGAFLGITAAAGLTGRSARESFTAPTAQGWAAIGYLLVLIISLVFWLLDGFSPDSAEIIRSQTVTLFGVGVGALAVILNVKRP